MRVVLHAKEVSAQFVAQSLFLVPLRNDGLCSVINPRSDLEHPELYFPGLRFVPEFRKVLIDDLCKLFKPDVGTNDDNSLVLCLLNFTSSHMGQSSISDVN